MLQKKIAFILRKKGTSSCLKLAESIEKMEVCPTVLHFRSLDLNATDAKAVAMILQQGKDAARIDSISFSYNLIGDAGAIDLAQSLPLSVSEIGLVGCEIGDQGGKAILNWMQNTSNLQMICIEQNNFSECVKKEYNTFKKDYPEVLVVI